MSHPDPKIRSFIIRTRLEKQGNSRRDWYGWVIQEPRNRRVYFRNLLECFDIIAAALDRDGVYVGWLWRVRRFLRLDRAVRGQAEPEILAEDIAQAKDDVDRHEDP